MKTGLSILGVPVQPLLGCTLFAISLSLSGCGRQRVDPELSELSTYQCQDDTVLTARLDDEIAIADLPDFPNVVLSRVDSDFGEKYTDGTRTLRVSGAIASVDVSGETIMSNCKLQDPETVGTDPDWPQLVDPTSIASYQETCEIYPEGANEPSNTVACQFSQRQGFIQISREDGTIYEFKPTGNLSGVYEDRTGSEVYRQSGLGDQGHVYRLADETIYVYWEGADTSEAAFRPSSRRSATNTLFSSESSSEIYVPQTSITVLENKTLALSIVDQELEFDGVLTAENEEYVGQDGNISVRVEPSEGRISLYRGTSTAPFYEYSVGTISIDEAVTEQPETDSSETESESESTEE